VEEFVTAFHWHMIVIWCILGTLGMENMDFCVNGAQAWRLRHVANVREGVKFLIICLTNNVHSQ